MCAQGRYTMLHLVFDHCVLLTCFCEELSAFCHFCSTHFPPSCLICEHFVFNHSLSGCSVMLSNAYFLITIESIVTRDFHLSQCGVL